MSATLVTLVVLIAIVGALALLISRRPAAFSISRTAAIAAPPQIVFDTINDLRKWESWSPWAKLDPNATNRFSGPAAGAGASMSWAGNNKVGVGRMTITQSRPDELVGMRLEFEKPMKAVNTVEFELKQEGAESTVVSWTMSGANNFIGKAFGLVVDCDKMIGGQFEQGLASLKSVSEAARGAARAA
ncbi:SRPBCC family protein [Methylocapsa palsarum]|uniref:Polyketide cyclase / dehydrase and lipid transport n=1 Tax=Methylocapsa palsarum TaxID=1612308 RepID=A0A1I4CPS8_9HYPH|nr:SRPBCC family protein [Methylocapsa palsarum]SFK82650.1 Polyketide cyclase / dehydrase and lipid transport [Methylocapsa palsarum]